MLRPLLTRTAHSGQSSGAADPIETASAPAVLLQVGASVLLFVVAVYGGYFGAGIGILVIAAFDLIRLADIQFPPATEECLMWQPPSHCCDSLPCRR
jgi:uncharacterized membrane protein YfcA